MLKAYIKAVFIKEIVYSVKIYINVGKPGNNTARSLSHIPHGRPAGMGEDDGEDKRGHQWVWISEEEADHMGNVSQSGSQSELHVQVRTDEIVYVTIQNNTHECTFAARRFDYIDISPFFILYSGRMRDHSSCPWLTALCCRSFGLSLACLAVGSSSPEPLRSAAKLCSFSWAWISACMRHMAWVRARDLTLCQVPKLTNYQGKNKRAVTMHVKKYQSYSWCALNAVNTTQQRTLFSI